jgi:molybdenum cofactor cytidylyltransferase
VFEIVENRNASDGMGSSISEGIKQSGDVDGAIVVLGDMPFIKRSTYLELLAAFQEHPGKSIFAPQYEERRGHPVLFRGRHFADLMALTSDTGAKRILAENESVFLAVPTRDAGVLSDIDLPADDLRIY